MAMIVGDAAAMTGMASAIYTGILAKDAALAAYIASEASPYPVRVKMQSMANGIALGIVPYIQAAAQSIADVSLVGGLQTSQAAGTLTTQPGGTTHILGTIA